MSNTNARCAPRLQHSQPGTPLYVSTYVQRGLEGYAATRISYLDTIPAHHSGTGYRVCPCVATPHSSVLISILPIIIMMRPSSVVPFLLFFLILFFLFLFFFLSPLNSRGLSGLTQHTPASLLPSVRPCCPERIPVVLAAQFVVGWLVITLMTRRLLRTCGFFVVLHDLPNYENVTGGPLPNAALQTNWHCVNVPASTRLD